MKIRYEFVNGEINEVEVDAALGAQLLELEHKMQLRDRAETRRHDSYDALMRKGVQFADTSEPGVEESVLAKLESAEIARALERIPVRQAKILRMVYFEGRICASIAREWGLSFRTVNSLFHRAQEHLAKSLHKDPPLS